MDFRFKPNRMETNHFNWHLYQQNSTLDKKKKTKYSNPKIHCSHLASCFIVISMRIDKRRHIHTICMRFYFSRKKTRPKDIEKREALTSTEREKENRSGKKTWHLNDFQLGKYLNECHTVQQIVREALTKMVWFLLQCRRHWFLWLHSFILVDPTSSVNRHPKESVNEEKTVREW